MPSGFESRSGPRFVSPTSTVTGAALPPGGAVGAGVAASGGRGVEVSVPPAAGPERVVSVKMLLASMVAENAPPVTATAGPGARLVVGVVWKSERLATAGRPVRAPRSVTR